MNLSASVNGKPLQVVAAGSTIHTATASTTNVWDEIWAWVSYNTLIGSQTITVRFGDATSPDHVWTFTPEYLAVPRLIIPGLLLQNAQVVSVSYAVTTSGNVSIFGFVNRITN
jgi:hypothetical protein